MSPDAIGANLRVAVLSVFRACPPKEGSAFERPPRAPFEPAAGLSIEARRAKSEAAGQPHVFCILNIRCSGCRNSMASLPGPFQIHGKEGAARNTKILAAGREWLLNG